MFDLNAEVYSALGRIGDATWAFVDSPNGRGIVTVGSDGAPQVTLTPHFIEAHSVSGTKIWFAQWRDRPSLNPRSGPLGAASATQRIIAFDVSDAAAPTVDAPLELPFALPGIDSFSIGDTLAIFVHRGNTVVWNRQTGEHREHNLGSDLGNFHTWCTTDACFVAAQSEISTLGLRLRTWRFDSLAAPTSVLVADEAARDVLSAPDGDARWLVWTSENRIHARRIEASGVMPGPIQVIGEEPVSPTPRLVPNRLSGMDVLFTIHRTGVVHRVSLEGALLRRRETVPLEPRSEVSLAATTEGTLFVISHGDLHGVRRARGHSHRWRFEAATVFHPAGQSFEARRELFSKSGGGLFTVRAIPLAGPGGFAVVYLFGYHPWDEPAYWLIRNRC